MSAERTDWRDLQHAHELNRWLHDRGWSVAVHNYYRQHGGRRSFWLWTNGASYVTGESPDSLEALRQCAEAAEMVEVASAAHDSHRVLRLTQACRALLGLLSETRVRSIDAEAARRVTTACKALDDALGPFEPLPAPDPEVEEDDQT